MPSSHEARLRLGEYTRDLIARHCADERMRAEVEGLLAAPGFVLSDSPRSLLAVGAVTAFEVLSGRSWRHAVPAAAALDLVFTAIEFVDKALDDEEMAAHTAWDHRQGTNAALVLESLGYMALDDLLASGFSGSEIAASRLAITRVIAETSTAQHLDVAYEQDPGVTLDQSLELTQLKGGPLVSGVGRVVAPLTQADSQVCAAVADFAWATGTMAQIVNDITDSSVANHLKSDVRRRKKTLPLVYLVQCGDSDVYAPEKRWLMGQHRITEDQEARIRTAVLASGAVDFASVMAEAYRTKALDALAPIADRIDTKPLIDTLLG